MSKVYRSVLLLVLIACSFGGAYLFFHDGIDVTEYQASVDSNSIGPVVATVPSSSVSSVDRNIAASAQPMLSAENLRERMRRDTHGLSECTHDDGGATVHLQGRYSHVTVALPDGDGGWVYRCFDNYEELQAALAGAVPMSSENSATSEPVYQ
ncbi:MAG: hypothetical protein AB3N63_19650 [Puniceicoccaceae bacterium]